MKRHAFPVTLALVAAAFLLGAWGLLAFPEAGLAAPKKDRPGAGGGGEGGGETPVCVTFAAPGSVEGIESDLVDIDGISLPYCNNNKEKLDAIMTPDGHLRLRPDRSKNQTGRKLFADVDFYAVPCNPDDGWTGPSEPPCGVVGKPSCQDEEVQQFLVGGLRNDFNMRAMGITEPALRTDVNLSINLVGIDTDIGNRIQFDPTGGLDGAGEGLNRFGLDTSCTTFVTVRRLDEDGDGTFDDVWEIENGGEDAAGTFTVPSRGLLFERNSDADQWQAKSVVTVPWFKATVRFK